MVAKTTSWLSKVIALQDTNKRHSQHGFRNHDIPKINAPSFNFTLSQTRALLKLSLCVEKSICYMNDPEYQMGEGNAENEHQKGKRIERAWINLSSCLWLIRGSFLCIFYSFGHCVCIDFCSSVFTLIYPCFPVINETQTCCMLVRMKKHTQSQTYKIWNCFHLSTQIKKNKHLQANVMPLVLLFREA